jgi:hypothetical protein
MHTLGVKDAQLPPSFRRENANDRSIQESRFRTDKLGLKEPRARES